MKVNTRLRIGTLLTALAGWLMLAAPCTAAERAIYVNPTTGSDDAPGTKDAPLRSQHRGLARQLAQQSAPDAEKPLIW